MFKTMREGEEAACTLLKKLRDGTMDFADPGISDPEYRVVIDYIVEQEFVIGLYGQRTADGRFLISDPDSPRLTRKGRAFIKEMERKRE